MDIRKHTLRSALRLECGERGYQSHIPGVSYTVFTACESPFTGGEYRASNTSKRGTVEVMNQAVDQICPEEAVPRVADSYSSLKILKTESCTLY